MVLPSIRKNILIPNAKYRCDIFVHYFHKHKEDAGRMNLGGHLDPDEVLLLKDVVANISSDNDDVTVQIVSETDDEFFQARKEQLHRYENTMTEEGKLAYYAWKEQTWSKSSQTNVVRQWHSIDAAFNLMEKYSREQHPNKNIKYTRVGMFRNDAMFLTPIDIMNLGNGRWDTTTNTHFVIPSFANFPMNDRMIYGPYEAVKIWSTKRFELLEQRVAHPETAGKVLHSERLLNYNIVPTIMKQFGYEKVINPEICFVRTRANSRVIFNDCRLGTPTMIPVIGSLQQWKSTIEELHGHRNCVKQRIDDDKIGAKYLKC